MLEKVDLKVMKICNSVFFRFYQEFEAFCKEAEQPIHNIGGIR